MASKVMRSLELLAYMAEEADSVDSRRALDEALRQTSTTRDGESDEEEA